MPTEHPHVSVIITNWNFWQDTLECLESVLKTDYPNYNIILIDDNSDNDSIANIMEWASGDLNHKIQTKFEDLVYPLIEKPIAITELDVVNRKPAYHNINEGSELGKILFLKSKPNFGFTGVNNISFAVAESLFKSKYYFMLNNDTVIRKDTLTKLIEEMENDPEIGSAQSTIYYYNNSEMIANAGGRILPWGQTKYYKKIQKGTAKEISFINGCANCIAADTIQNVGALSEKFFHGEDDFEFSMRLSKNNIKKLCVANSHVFHKIGLSADEILKINEKKVMLSALDRMVDLKSYYSKFRWLMWRPLASMYYFALLNIKYNIKFIKALKTVSYIYKYSGKIEDMKRTTWEGIMQEIDI